MGEWQFDQMVIMVAIHMHVYGKKLLKTFFSRTRRPMTLGLGMLHLKCGAYQVCSNDDPR